MISQTVEYALRAVVYLGSRAPTAQTTEQIARETKVPPAYLSKVLQSLGQAGIVRSQRGVGGGITLIPEPDALSILDVVNAVDPIRRFRECPAGLASHGAHLCPLHSRLDEALAQVENAFRETTLAELLGQPRRSRRTCKFPLQKHTAGAKSST